MVRDAEPESESERRVDDPNTKAKTSVSQYESGGEGGTRTHIAEGARFTVWGANQLLNLPPFHTASESKESVKIGQLSGTPQSNRKGLPSVGSAALLHYAW